MANERKKAAAKKIFLHQQKKRKEKQKGKKLRVKIKISIVFYGQQEKPCILHQFVIITNSGSKAMHLSELEGAAVLVLKYLLFNGPR